MSDESVLRRSEKEHEAVANVELRCDPSMGSEILS
jgi:hypothetical protein